MTDHRLEQIIGNLLRTGVAVAAAVVAVGGIWYLAAGGHAPVDYRNFHPAPGGWQWSPQGVIQLGLLILIATPVARVVFSLVGFALERDRVYVAITIVVLAVLLYGLM